MTLSFVLFLFLAHLGIGIVFTLVLVGREAGVKFFRFNAGFAAVLLLVALAMRPEPVRLGTDAQGVAFALILIATAAVLVYWATIGRVLARLRPLWVWTAVLSGGAALVAQGVAAAGGGGLPAALTAASFVTSAALLGGTSTAMILLAFMSFAPWITLRPTPPQPNTATLMPISALGLFMTPPTPVVTEQPMRAATSMGTSSGIGWQACCGQMIVSENTPTLPSW